MSRKPVDPEVKANMDLRCKVTDTQYFYVRSKAALENIEFQQVIRQLIDKAYAREKSNGVDVIRLAMDRNLL